MEAQKHEPFGVSLSQVERGFLRFRVSVILCLIVASCVLIAQDLSPVALAKGDWPQILGPSRNGIYTGPEIVPSFPRTGPPAIWKRDVGAGFAGPSVVGYRL